MRRRAWSLVPLSTLIVAFALLLLFGSGCIFAFNAYIGSLGRDARTLLAEAVSEVEHDRNMTDAIAAGNRIATRLISPTLILVFIGSNHRVTVFHSTNTALGPPAVTVRDRDDRSAEPVATGGFSRLVLGLASICGLQVVRAHYGGLDIYVKSNDVALANAIRAYTLPFAIALALVFLASATIVRFLTTQGLRPLTDVTAALERFAAGDFTPQFVATSSQAELGTLAHAYNGAVAQVERAFGERERANAMMRQFIADAGHQLRTPLTVIRGFIAILADPTETAGDERRRIIHIMTQQTVLMRVLIDNLMLLDRWESEISPASFEPIDVTQLVEDLVTMIRDANHPRTLAFHAADVGFARIDPHELTYAVMNILDNAVKYTSGNIEVTVEIDDETLVLTFSDQGPGMPPSIADHAFDRFFRGKRRDVDGSGLGLAIARKVIERAAGTISISTSPQAGTTVRIDLPRAITANEVATV